MTQSDSSVIDLSNGSGSWNIHSSICAAVPTDGSEGAPVVVQPAQYMLDAVELTTANEVYSFNGNINDLPIWKCPNDSPTIHEGLALSSKL